MVILGIAANKTVLPVEQSRKRRQSGKNEQEETTPQFGPVPGPRLILNRDTEQMKPFF